MQVCLTIVMNTYNKGCSEIIQIKTREKARPHLELFMDTYCHKFDGATDQEEETKEPVRKEEHWSKAFYEGVQYSLVESAFLQDYTGSFTDDIGRLIANTD